MSHFDPPPFDGSQPVEPAPRPRAPVVERKPKEYTRLELLRLRSEAKHGNTVLTAEQEAALKPLSARPEVKPLSVLLDETPDTPPDRITGLSMVGGNSLLFASYKVGKTSLLLNVVRSLVDGTPFLDSYDVRQLDGSLVYWNYELPEAQFTHWLRMQGIKNTHKVVPLNLRGRPVHPQSESDFEWLVTQIAAHEGEANIVDPLAVAIKGDPNRGDVAHEFTEALDDIQFLSGSTDLFMSAHTGHPRGTTKGGIQSNLWAAGHSRFMGWADALWTFAEAPTGTRLFSAKGRYDDDVPEMQLAFDPATKRLSHDGWTGRRVRVEVTPQEDPCSVVLEFIEANPGASTRTIRDKVPGSSEMVDKCLTDLIEDGLVRWETGPRKAHLHFAVAPESLLMDGA